MSSFAWISIDGRELERACSEDQIRDIIPAAAAVYVWRRRYWATPGVSGSSDECGKWIEQTASAPAARIGESAISHCVTVDGLRLGGGGLTPDKQEFVQKAVGKRSVREYMIGFVESLTLLAPNLYVGHTNNLARRVSQHVAGETELRAYMERSLGLGWDDVQLNYGLVSVSDDISDDAKKMLELFELIAQRVLVPFGTVRPG